MNITDLKTLYQQFISLGRERNKITYKLLVLLPQIYEQKIYKTHGYATIYEYAGKLAGLSHSVVEKALKLEEKLKNKPKGFIRWRLLPLLPLRKTKKCLRIKLEY